MIRFSITIVFAEFLANLVFVQILARKICFKVCDRLELVVNVARRNLKLIDVGIFTVWMMRHVFMTSVHCRTLKGRHHCNVCLLLLSSGHALTGRPVVRKSASIECRTTLMAGAATCICGWSLKDCGGSDTRTTACFAASEGWMDEHATVTRQSEARTIELSRDWLNRIIH